MNLGETIKAARKRAGRTQAELAKQLGVDQSLVGRFERGDIVPRVDQLEDIAQALGVGPADLLGAVHSDASLTLAGSIDALPPHVRAAVVNLVEALRR